jgi:hypothetical protein
MAFSNLTRIILYVIGGISLLVMLFFYMGPKTVNYDDLEARVEEALNPPDISPVAPLPTVDTTAQDSAAVEEIAVAEEEGDQGTLVTSEAATAAVDLRDHMSGWEYLVWFRTDIALMWAYILVVITLIAAIVFPLISVFSNTRALIRLIAVLAAAAILVVISYLVSSDTPIDIIGYTGTDNSDPATLRMIDTVLFVTYMLFGLALASILYAIVSRAFK